MNTSNVMDWVFVLAAVQLLGLKYLMTATDGWLLFAKVMVNKRKVALAIGMGIIWIPLLLVWIAYGHSPIDIWNGTTAWWQADIGIVGKAVAVASWWALLSPLQALLAIWTIHSATISKQPPNAAAAY